MRVCVCVCVFVYVCVCVYLSVQDEQYFQNKCG